MGLTKQVCTGGRVGVCYWQMTDGSVLPVKIPFKEITRQNDAIPPEPGARWTVAFAVPELDTPDGYASLDMCWEERDPYALDARLEELRTIRVTDGEKMDPTLAAELDELSDPAILYRPTADSVNVLRVATSDDPGDYWLYEFEWAVRPSKDDADQTHRKVGFRYQSTGHRATLTQYDKVDPSKETPPPVVPAITKTALAGVIQPGASPTWDATSTGQNSGTLLAVNHTIGAGSNMAIYGSLSQDGVGSNTAAATFNLANMTLITAVTATGNRLATWYLAGPVAGLGAFSYSGSGLPFNAVGNSYSGVLQATPAQNAVQSASASATTLSDTVTSAVGNIVLDAMGVNNESDSNVLADTGQTKRGGIGGNGMSCEMSEAPGAATYPAGWHGWSAARVSHIAWDVPAAAAAAGQVPYDLSHSAQQQAVMAM